MIELTEAAVTQVKKIQIADKKENTKLRLSVIGGGCSGMSYKLDFDDNTSEKDKLFTFDGVEVVVDPKSYLFLKGTVLDFTSGLNGKGFEFSNPNASKNCGCGNSFSA